MSHSVPPPPPPNSAPPPSPNPDISARYPTASARLPVTEITEAHAAAPFSFRELGLYVKNPRTIVLLMVAVVQLLLLSLFDPRLIVFPLAALVCLAIGSRRSSLVGAALLTLAAGAVAIYFAAGLKVFIAFAYPAVFASIIVTTHLRRMMVTLVTLVVVFGISTLVLDMSQQEINYGNKKVIIFASMWAAGEKPKQPIYDELIARFEKENPEYKVAMRYDGRWVLSKNRPRLLTGKDVPDIIEGGKEELRILAQEDYAVPLDTAMEQNSPYTGKPWKDDWIPAIGALGRYNLKPRSNTGELKNPDDGKMLMAGGIVYHLLWFYNKAILRKLGVAKLPETWDEFKALCDKAKAENITPIMLDSVYADMISNALLVNSLPEGELRKTVTGAPGAKPFTDPEYVRIFRLEREFADSYFQPSWQASQHPAAQQDFATGKGLFVLCGSWLPSELNDVAIKDKSIFELGTMPIPHFNDQPAGTFNIDNSGWMVLKNGGETAGAIKLLQFLTTHWGREIALRGGNPVAFARDPLPVEMNDVADAIHHMKRAANEPIAEYGAKWQAYVFKQLHSDFFEAKKGTDQYITPEAFAAKLEEATQKYRANKGEAAWE